MVSASAANVIAIKALRALPASAKSQRKAASRSTTLYAMAEGGASVTAAIVWRVTSVHTARPAWAALTPASRNCQWWEITIMFIVVVAIVLVSCLLQHVGEQIIITIVSCMLYRFVV